MPARWSRIHSSAKILSMKRSLRVSFVSQCTTSLSECAVTGSMSGGSFISCSCAVTWIDGTGYVVFPLGNVNGVGCNLLAQSMCARVVSGLSRVRRGRTQAKIRNVHNPDRIAVTPYSKISDVFRNNGPPTHVCLSDNPHSGSATGERNDQIETSARFHNPVIAHRNSRAGAWDRGPRGRSPALERRVHDRPWPKRLR